MSEDEYTNNINNLKEYLDECPICYNSSEQCIVLKKCNHKYCEPCIKKWLTKNKSECPLCRQNLK